MADPTSTIIIRDAAPADLLAVHRQMCAVFTPASSECWSLEMLSEFLPRPEAILRIAKSRESEDLFGFVLARRAADETELLTLSVDGAQRRRGIACQLVKHFVIVSRECGVNRIFLEVRESNKPAQKLYLSQGFETVGRRRAYYRNVDKSRSDALTMRLKII